MTLKHIKIENLDDFFMPLSNRSEKGIYFYRFNKTSQKIDDFIYKYYEVARRSGVVIEGKIGNPTENNLSYYQEIMGMDFQMSMGFILDALKKWLPRMRSFQRENIAGAIYDVLDELRKNGKNDNMLKNAYIKFMCWLYYRFEGVVEKMNGENVPKILFIGDIVVYEFMLINILADAGCDVVFVQPHGDAAYIKADPERKKSFEYIEECSQEEKSEMRAFDDEFNIRSMIEARELKIQSIKSQSQKTRGEVQRAETLNNYGKLKDKDASNKNSLDKIAVLNCTNVWIEGNGLDDFLQPGAVRKERFNNLYENADKMFFNCYVSINGVWDKLTYENELYQFYLSLKAMKKNVVVISEMITKPDVDEIAGIRRGNYRDVFQLVRGLEQNISFSENPIVKDFLVNSFEETVYNEADRLKSDANINKILNKAVYLLCYINRYKTELFKNFNYDNIPCFIYMGGCNDENEALFMRFLARTPTDVLILCPDKTKKCRFEDKLLYEINHEQQLAVKKFPIQAQGMHIGTAAYHAERELDSLVYNDDTLFRNKQYDKAEVVSLQTMDREIKILWDTELKYRPGFSTVDGIVNMPVIFSKFSGVKDKDIREYQIMLKQLMTPETLVIDKAPHFLPTAPNPIKVYAVEFFKNGRLHRDMIKNNRAYQYGFLRDEMQEYILDKLEILIEKKYIKGTFENGTEYTIVSMGLNLPKEVTRLLQAFDFTKKNPKLLYINTSDELISLEDTIYLTFLHLLGFDVALFVPTGYNMENYFNIKLMEEHQIGDYMYDLNIPDWESIPLSLHTSWRDRIFRRG